jgi:hypothetical protein
VNAADRAAAVNVNAPKNVLFAGIGNGPLKGVEDKGEKKIVKKLSFIF